MKTPEEIKKGLQCCIKDCKWDNGCLYGAFDKCTTAMMEDALAYIRELEAKLAEYEKPLVPMNFVEAMNSDDLIWLEINAENDRPRIAEVVPCVTKPEERADILIMGQSRVAHLPYNNYGSSWRCWPRKPTDEERKAAKWDD